MQDLKLFEICIWFYGKLCFYIFAIIFLKALAFYHFISTNQLNSVTWESPSELCSHFNLQVSWHRFLELATPNDWAWRKLNYSHWICLDSDSRSLWTSKLALIGMCKALTLVKKSWGNFDSSTKRNQVQIGYDIARRSWNCVFLNFPAYVRFLHIFMILFEQTVTSCWVTPRATVATPLSTAPMASVSWRASREPRWCRRTAAANSCSGLTPANMWRSRC